LLFIISYLYGRMDMIVWGRGEGERRRNKKAAGDCVPRRPRYQDFAL